MDNACFSRRTPPRFLVVIDPVFGDVFLFLFVYNCHGSCAREPRWEHARDAVDER